MNATVAVKLLPRDLFRPPRSDGWTVSYRTDHLVLMLSLDVVLHHRSGTEWNGEWSKTKVPAICSSWDYRYSYCSCRQPML